METQDVAARLTDVEIKEGILSDEGSIGEERSQWDAHEDIPSSGDSIPVIGILAQLCKGIKIQFGKDQYLAASYVRWIEAAGAKVVPIKIDQKQSYYEELFNNLNGVLIPGGDQDLLDSGYADVTRFFLSAARKSFDEKNDYFPIWGTCLGMEEFAVLAEERNMLMRCEGCKKGMSTKFENEADEESRLLKGLPHWAKETLSKKEVAAHYHVKCLHKRTFQSSPSLRSEYRILSTAFDDEGNEFVDMLEAIRYPFYGCQFHPEKNAFELGNSISHEADAILASLSLALFFVGEAKKNQHKFVFSSSSSSSSAREKLINHYAPTYTGDVISFYQCYFF